MPPSYSERRGRRKRRPICVGEGPDTAMLTEFQSGFVRSLVSDAADFTPVQSEIVQIPRGQRAQLAQRFAVNLAARSLGAIICDQRVEAGDDPRAATDAVGLVCHLSAVSALFEYVCFRSLETKIGKCCACTILFYLNAAMQHLHRPNGSILCVSLHARSE